MKKRSAIVICATAGPSPLITAAADRSRPIRRARRNIGSCAQIGVWLVTCVVSVLMSQIAVAAVKPASPDGEATVYLLGKFSEDFDVAYRAVLKPAIHNKSWSSLSILLVGSQIPGPGASVGLASTPPSGVSTRPFTYVVYPGLSNDYRSYSATCAKGCIIELRGDARKIYASVNGKRLASWSRSDLYLQHPYIQLNAEVHGSEDYIFASLNPVRTIAVGRRLSRPICAFTTRGIEPTGLAMLIFRGKTSNAAGAFIDLLTGAHRSKC